MNWTLEQERMGSVQTEVKMAQRRAWKIEEKLAVVLEVLKGQESVASICHRHGVAMNSRDPRTALLAIKAAAKVRYFGG